MPPPAGAVAGGAAAGAAAGGGAWRCAGAGAGAARFGPLLEVRAPERGIVLLGVSRMGIDYGSGPSKVAGRASNFIPHSGATTRLQLGQA